MKTDERLIYEAIFIGLVEVAFIIYMTVKILKQKNNQ